MFEDDALSGENNVSMSNFNISLNDREQSHALKSNAISESYHPLQNSLLKINSTLTNLWSMLNSVTRAEQRKDAWTSPKAIPVKKNTHFESSKD